MTMRPLALAFLAAWAVAPPAPAQAPKPAEPPKSFDLAAIDAYVAAVVRDRGIPGLALAIVRDGEVVLSRGYGLRSREDHAPVGPDTPFAIGSVTKQFACACIFLLAEDGKLSVDDKVDKYFPGLTRAGDISLYQLMTHTSGYADYYPLDFVDRRMARPTPVDDVIREYAGGKLDFEPGTRWSYSNTGYLILGRVAEKVSGKPLGEFLRDRILAPLGMSASTFDPTTLDPARARGYYSFALGPPEPAPPEAEGWLHAAGGLWASAPDLARWDVALMEGRVLKPESLRRMTEAVALADGRTRNYGCGLAVGRYASGAHQGNATLSHTGAVSGFRASNFMVRETRSAVVVLINGEQGDAGMIRALQDLVIQAAARAPDLVRVDGPSPRDAALGFFRQMQDGELDRGKLGEEFSIYLTPGRVRDSAARLKALGEPDDVAVEGIGERGGLEVATIRMTFKSATLKGLLYRSADGKIQQLLFAKE